MAHQPTLFDTDLPPWELDAQSECRAAKVVFAEPPFGPFDYRVPDQLVDQVQPGVRVLVPLGKGNRQIVGYCVAVATVAQSPDALKPVLEVVDDEPLITAGLLKLLQWMSRYYLAPLGQVIEAAVPTGVRSQAGSRLVTVVSINEEKCADAALVASLPPKQQHVLAVLRQIQRPLSIDQLREAANCSAGPIQALRKNGFLTTAQQRIFRHDHAPLHPPRPTSVALSADQRIALNHILTALDTKEHHTILLHGVTGSGKTEVYMQAIEEVLRHGRQAIVLVPEISLTPQTRQRFVARFGNVAVLHSHLSDVDRHTQWRRIQAGEASVVIGPRSAIFAPTPHLGLIILDEEHENSFKQDTVPRYHARDVALHRAYLEGIPLVLGSATPSLESWKRAQDGAYRLASLPRRILNRPLPTVEIVDMRLPQVRFRKGVISRPLYEAVAEALNGDGQVILLLNRRGFATAIQCPACGHVVACPHCDLPLTHHRDGGKACCHYCDFQMPTPPVCPQCHHAEIHFGGVGTQRLEQEALYRFPGIQVARMDSDTMRRPGSHERVLQGFREGTTRILLGTQMIAKGLDFPNVLLVGVVNADTGLHFPDFRAAEKTFQMVTQVAGRTGRGDKPGRVIVQTCSPEHSAISAAVHHDYLSFARQELAHRQRFQFPPFGSLARIIFRGPEQRVVEQFAEATASKLESLTGLLAIEVRIIGPAICPLAKLRGNFRFHLLVQSEQPASINRLLQRAIAELKPPADVQFVWDIDPVDTL
ncbi:MAG: primosomal protein N' [Pirellulaceae bacterium]|nr:MAG: primosomal protein N' [Pirellulaceae bacterium]